LAGFKVKQVDIVKERVEFLRVKSDSQEVSLGGRVGIEAGLS
jgi:hypothetical protein